MAVIGARAQNAPPPEAFSWPTNSHLDATIFGLQPQDLLLVEPGPVHGTFYSLQDIAQGRPTPPWPFVPVPGLDIYAGRGVYFFDDLAVDYAALKAARSLSLSLAQAGAAPPWPGGDPGEPGEDPGVPYVPPLYSYALGLLHFPPRFTPTNTIVLSITNSADAGWLTARYDLFWTTNLTLLPAPELCQTNWAWLARSLVGQSEFVIPNLGTSEGYFRLGTMLDSDGDGLTDAYELLVSHTPPNIFTLISGDGMGTPDAWYFQHGLDPHMFNLDSDLDGLANWQEYLNGTSPHEKPAFAVWVSQPGHFGLP